jgi:hypothetical protein
MPNVRVIGAVGLALFAMILAIGGALAQTAIGDMTGQRVLVLKIVERSTARPSPNAKLTATTVTKRSLRSRITRHARLARKHHPEVIAQARAPEETRLAQNPATAPPAPPQTPYTAERLGPLLVGGNATQVAWSGEVKESDPPVTDARLQADAAPPQSSTNNDPPPPVVNAGLKSDFANVAVAQHQGSDTDNASWILHYWPYSAVHSSPAALLGI